MFSVTAEFERVVDSLWLCSLVLMVADHIQALRTGCMHARARTLTVIKLMFELVQAVPDALGLDAHPLLDALCGLCSSIVGTYIMWSHKRRVSAMFL